MKQVVGFLIFCMGLAVCFSARSLGSVILGTMLVWLGAALVHP